MKKVKIFSACRCENLEAEINKWFTDNVSVNILDIQYQPALRQPAYPIYTAMIVYEDFEHEK